MTGSKKHSEGFTLAELLLSIAIILVLAAIAIPSIVNAQNNMRMAELNNAAESIANAAQTQMTAKKAAGTWLALIDGPDGKVKYPAATGSVDSDTYYMVADDLDSLQGARGNGIVPSLSIDDAVRNGDYVIVFKASTASVEAVYYTDGKSGFFGSSPARTNAAQTYYASHGSTDQAARMKNDPMIGYYQGTPAGATDAVALQNPAIWVDDENSLLCVENPNLAGSEDWAKSSSLSVTIQNLEEGKNDIAFTIGGLQGSETYTVESSDPKVELGLSNSDGKVYQLVERTSTSEHKTVYKIDLNALANVLEKQKDPSEGKESPAQELISKFIANDHVLVCAQAAVPSKSCIPSTAKAYVRWPEPLAKLTVLVTNPGYEYLDETGTEKKSESYITGNYDAPSVDLVTSSGGPVVTDITAKEKTKIENLYKEASSPAINTSLGNENIEETRQVYSGKWVKLAEAADQDANMRVSVGSYTPNGSKIKTNSVFGEVQSSTSKHMYQIYEIWVNKQRAGYLKNDVWHWDGEVGKVFADSGCVDRLVEGVPTAGVETFTIDTRKLYDTDKDVIPLNDEGGYDVYVRTTPKTAEVKEYFEAKAKTLAQYLSWSSNVGTTGSRGMNKGAPVRKPFENEFGASSTVALWNTTTMRGTLDNLPEAGDLRIYYTATPAIAWGDMKFGVNDYSPYTTLPSAVLWFFPKKANYTWVPAETPDAYVRDFESTDDDNPKAFKLIKPKEGADYEIPYGSTTSNFVSEGNDQLFYRAIEYYDYSGKNINWQYVPYTVQNEASYASVPEGPAKEGYAFTGWLVDASSTVSGDNDLVISAGSLVGSYDDKLAHGAIRLTARYVKVGIGLMYLEFDASGVLSGYYGYQSNDTTTTLFEKLPDNNEIEAWGYYVVVPEGSDSPRITKGANRLASDSISIKIGEADYTAYQYTLMPTDDGALRQKNPVITCMSGNASQTVTFNVNFAAAISLGDVSSSIDWGKESSPWNIRHADQFPGCLSGGNRAAVMKKYANDVFLQGRDIDMGTRTTSSAVFYNTEFGGIYNGNNNKILNAHVNGSSVLRVGTDRGLSWLFPRVSGTSDRRAALKNINLVEVAGSYLWAAKGDDYSTAIGMLAGYISQCDVDNCNVLKKSGSDASTVIVTMENMSSNTLGWGVLVGAAANSTIKNSTIQNVKFVTSLQSGSAWGRSVWIGTIVGYADNTSIEKCKAASATIGTTIPTPTSFGKNIIDAGGIVGQCEGSSTVQSCEVSSVSFSVPVEQDGKNRLLFLGIYAGAINDTEQLDSNSFLQVSATQGDVSTEITDAYGRML